MRGLMALSVLLVMLFLAGCGGGNDVAETIPGDFFPLRVGDQWTYRFDTKVEIHNEVYESSGTSVSRLVRTQNISVDGSTANAYVIRTTFNLVPPDFGPEILPILRSLLEHLFSADGGLAAIEAYYVPKDTNSDGTPDRVTLAATSPVGGATAKVAAPAPFILMPPVNGIAAGATRNLSTDALLPADENIIRRRVASDLRYLTGLGYAGISGDTIIRIDKHMYEVEFNGHRGVLDGRCRQIYLDTVGLADSDNFSLVSFGQQQARVSAFRVLTNFTNIP